MKCRLNQYLLILVVIIFTVGCATVQSRWKKAESLNTFKAYEEFFFHSKVDDLRPEALQRMDNILFEKAMIERTIKAYDEYLIFIGNYYKYALFVSPNKNELEVSETFKKHKLEFANSIKDTAIVSKLASKHLGRNEIMSYIFQMWPNNPESRLYFGFKLSSDGSWQRVWEVQDYGLTLNNELDVYIYGDVDIMAFELMDIENGIIRKPKGILSLNIPNKFKYSKKFMPKSIIFSSRRLSIRNGFKLRYKGGPWVKIKKSRLTEKIIETDE